MSDLTRYRRMPGFHKVGTGKALPPGSYSSAVADWVPDTTLQAIADAWNDESGVQTVDFYKRIVYGANPVLAALVDGLADE